MKLEPLIPRRHRTVRASFPYLLRKTFQAMKAGVLLLTSIVVVTSCRQPQDSTKPSEDYERTKADLRTIAVLLDAFAEDCGRYPSSKEGLAALVIRPEGLSAAKWRGPYARELVFDAWGHPYFYESPGKTRTNAYDLYSRGPDGISKERRQ